MTKVFCFHTDIQEIDLKYLLNSTHAHAVADYVNRMVIDYLRVPKDSTRKRESKLERFMKHSALTIEALSSTKRFVSKKYRAIPAKNKNIGICIPYFD